jgi:hypothetical protein
MVMFSCLHILKLYQMGWLWPLLKRVCCPGANKNLLKYLTFSSTDIIHLLQNLHRSQYTYTLRNHGIYLGFEVLTMVVMKSTVFWDITPCGPLKFNRRFRGTCRLHFQGRISQARYQHESRWNGGSDMFLQNVVWVSAKGVIYQKIMLFSHQYVPILLVKIDMHNSIFMQKLGLLWNSCCWFLHGHIFVSHQAILLGVHICVGCLSTLPPRIFF